MSLGTGYRNVKLGDLLPLSAVMEIEQARKKGTLTTSVLKAITARYKNELADLGVDDRYLAYLLSHALGVKD
jgi:hypothetical protein